MKKFTICMVLAVLCFLAAPVKAEVLVNDMYDYSGVEYVPCANGGSGEWVELSGTIHEVMSLTINGNNFMMKINYNTLGYSGVGLDTGDKYQATQVTNNLIKGSFVNGQYAENYLVTFKLVGPGKENNVLVHYNVHITINANGDITVQRDNLSTECN